jgi:hypothetical protein
MRFDEKQVREGCVKAASRAGWRVKSSFSGFHVRKMFGWRAAIT